MVLLPPIAALYGDCAATAFPETGLWAPDLPLSGDLDRLDKKP